MSNSKVLVTGGCGYKGSVLVPKLLSAGYDVTVADIQWFGSRLSRHDNLSVLNKDVRDISVKDLSGIESIIHLASVANDPCGDLDPKLTWEISALGTMQLADKAVRAGVSQFVYASSGSVYGVKEEPEVTEDLELTPISEYNKTKMVAERALLSYQDKMKVVSIRPATVCGLSPRMRLDVSVNMLTVQALKNGVITVFGGDQARPNIHMDDITDLYLHIVENSSHYEGIYNAGFENITILDIAKMVTDLVPADIQVTASNDPRSYRINSDRLLSTGFRPKKKVKDAISEIVDAWKNGTLEDLPEHYNLKWMQEKVIR